MLDLVAADPEDLGEDEEQDPEQHQRPDQRPEVAEHGAEVDALELGHRDQPEQVEEAPAAAAERRGAAHLAQLGGPAVVDSLTSLAAARSRSSSLVRQRDDRRGVGRAAEDDEVDRVVDVEGDAAFEGAVDPAVDEVVAGREQVLDASASIWTRSPALAGRRSARRRSATPNWQTPTPSALASDEADVERRRSPRSASSSIRRRISSPCSTELTRSPRGVLERGRRASAPSSPSSRPARGRSSGAAAFEVEPQVSPADLPGLADVLRSRRR